MKKVEQNSLVISDRVDLMDTLDSIATDLKKVKLILDDLMTSDAVKNCQVDTLTLMMNDYLVAIGEKQKLVNDFCNKCDSEKTEPCNPGSYKKEIINMLDSVDGRGLKLIYLFVRPIVNAK